MPWHNPDIRHMTYEEAARLKLTWEQLKIMAEDEKIKTYIKTNFNMLYQKVEDDITKDIFDPYINLDQTAPYFFALLDEEQNGEEPIARTFQRCEDKLIEDALKEVQE